MPAGPDISGGKREREMHNRIQTVSVLADIRFSKQRFSHFRIAGFINGCFAGFANEINWKTASLLMQAQNTTARREVPQTRLQHR